MQSPLVHATEEEQRAFDLKADFFFNWDALYDVGGKRSEEAKGHKILLLSDDLSLKIAILVEGHAIDFLFEGRNARPYSRDSLSNSARCKNYIRSLPENKQIHIVIFYEAIFTAIIDYQAMLESYGSCWCCIVDKAKQKLHSDALAAFYVLYSALCDPSF
jgi:hypothetical protein